MQAYTPLKNEVASIPSGPEQANARTGIVFPVNTLALDVFLINVFLNVDIAARLLNNTN